MNHAKKLALVTLALTAVFPGCSRLREITGKPSASSSSSAEVTTTSASATAKALAWSSKPKPEGGAHPWVDEGGRQGKCTFVEWKGTGDDRKSMFRIELPPGKKADHVQTWQFYYDKDGKQIDEYPSATNPSSFEETGVDDLGEKGTRIKPEVDRVECEITEIGFTDGTYWWNKNLMSSGLKRPRGGHSNAVLKEHSGEKIAVSVVDQHAVTVSLKNLGDRTTSRVKVELICWKEDGPHETDNDYVDVAIAAGETLTTKVDVAASKFKECNLIEAAASRVEYADDTVWSNRNLEAYGRP